MYRSFDPLPVLDGISGDDKDDTETLQSMVEDTDTEDPNTDVEDSARIIREGENDKPENN